MQETWVWSLGWDGTLGKEMATHSSILAWEIPWTEDPGGLQSMESQKTPTRLNDWVSTGYTAVVYGGMAWMPSVPLWFCILKPRALVLQNVTVFENKAFKGLIKVKWSHGVLSNSIWFESSQGEIWTYRVPVRARTKREDHLKRQREDGHFMPIREV